MFLTARTSPIFNPGTDRVHRLRRVGFQHAGLGNFALHALSASNSRATPECQTEAAQGDATANGSCPPSAPTPRAASSCKMASPIDQICKVSGFADTVPMPDIAPTDEINRRVTVLLKLQESLDSINNSTAAGNSSDLPNDTAPN